MSATMSDAAIAQTEHRLLALVLASFVALAFLLVTALPALADLRFRGGWSQTVTYAKDDVVHLGGHSYRARVVNAGFKPDLLASNTQWQLLTGGYFSAGRWVSGRQYNKGDVVEFDGSSYVYNLSRSTVERPGTGSAWLLLALAGEQGPQGPVGPAGPQVGAVVDMYASNGQIAAVAANAKVMTNSMLVMVPAGARVHIAASAVVGTTAVPTTETLDYGVCYTNRFPVPPFQFPASSFALKVRSSGQIPISHNGFSPVLAAGVYRFGFCIENYTNVSFDDNDFGSITLMIVK
jgi:hypothetical protein